MERNREHRHLPDHLPADIWSDGVSLPSTGQFSASNTTPVSQQVQGIWLHKSLENFVLRFNPVLFLFLDF
jgi:hypothetical protein